MKYCDKWVVSNTEPKADALWVQPIKEQKDSINVKAFVDGKWKTAGGGTIADGSIPLKALDKPTQEAIDPVMASYNEYSKQYLTTEVTESGSLGFGTKLDSSYLEEMSYSINGGEWITVKNTNVPEQQSDNSGSGDSGNIDNRKIGEKESEDEVTKFLNFLREKHPSDEDSEETKKEAPKKFSLIKSGDSPFGIMIELDVQEGDIIRWKGKGKALCTLDIIEGEGIGSSLMMFGGTYNVYGNIASLLYGDDFEGEKPAEPAQYAQLLIENTGLIDATNLVLPSKVSTSSLYGFFADCSALEKAPLILPATELGIGCYARMFSSCKALTTAPLLPATTLAEHCYDSMFSNCRSLTVAPDLFATELVAGCYAYMFYVCSSLQYIKCLAKEGIAAEACTENWVSGINTYGTFIKADLMNDWSHGLSGIPSNWTIYNESYEMDKPALRYEVIDPSPNIISFDRYTTVLAPEIGKAYAYLDTYSGISNLQINLPSVSGYPKVAKIDIVFSASSSTAPNITFTTSSYYGILYSSSNEPMTAGGIYHIECIAMLYGWGVKWEKYTQG